MARRASISVTAVCLAAALWAGGGPSTGIESAQAVEPTVAPASVPAFSDPVWWPLRDPARTSCAWSNCIHDGKPYHGEYEIDWVDLDARLPDPPHDPIHAAGSGIFHVGQIDPGCREPGQTRRQGTWAWIDHGGGVATYYGHLDSIVAVDGSWVTPADQIATMGNSGAKCLVGPTHYYLHFEIRTNGFHDGVKQPIPSLYACVDGARRTFPDDLPGGWTSWNDVPMTDREKMPATDDSCIPDTFDTPDTPTGLRAVVAGRTSTRLNWDAPSSTVTSVVLATELWRPSMSAYSRPTYSSVTPSDTTLLDGLDEGRQYRIRIAFRGEAGSSLWSDSVVVVPGGPPARPAVRYVRPGVGVLHLGWTRPDSPGHPVTEYRVAIRPQIPGDRQRWTEMPGTDGYRRFDGLVPGVTYELKVRARNALGWGRWSLPSTGVPD